jgi:hypothetical protein
MGVEPTTSSLGSWHSTAELRPQYLSHRCSVVGNYEQLTNQ